MYKEVSIYVFKLIIMKKNNDRGMQFIRVQYLIWLCNRDRDNKRSNNLFPNDIGGAAVLVYY